MVYLREGELMDLYLKDRNSVCLLSLCLSFNLRSTKSEEENIFVIPHLRFEENPIALYISHTKVFT